MKRYIVVYTDQETGARSPIDGVTERDGYTAENYVEDCRDNADREWNEMLAAGIVELEEVKE